MITVQSLPQGVHCTMIPKEPYLSHAGASTVERALPAKGFILLQSILQGRLQRASPDWLISLRSPGLLP
jgi:hypothetical protein